MPIHFQDDHRKRIEIALQAYCREHFDQDLGILRTQELFEFVVGLIGATIYNQAVTDAQAWMQGKLLDLEGDVHETVRSE